MNKQHILRLSHILKSKGITQVVVSPGSRNAPVIIIMDTNKDLEMLSVPDERSAGFVALGLSMKSGKPVALLCTSGTAALNYAPAIAEAYYQKIPLLVLTADRPEYLIDQGDSQTIRQKNIYANYIRKSFQLPSMIKSQDDEWYVDRIINEAIDRTLNPARGPVHINIPIEEPLYDLKTNLSLSDVRIIELVNVESRVNIDTMNKLAEKWNVAASKLILVGQLDPDSRTTRLLEELSNDTTVAVLTECTSNIPNSRYIACIDRALTQIAVERKQYFKPEILLTIGGAIVSKKIKALLRNLRPNEHWHVNEDTDVFHMDTYKSLTTTIPVKPDDFLEQLTAHSIPGMTLSDKRKKIITTDDLPISTYLARWKHADEIASILHDKYISELPFTDLKAYHHIFAMAPVNAHIHLANSTPVRYAQLFDHQHKTKFFSNRGTSGIDGCVSTAAGYAVNHRGLTIAITGDIGFLYDSNSLWNRHLPGSFRIIVINNKGGNIFRIIDGPSNYDALEPYIETAHNLDAEGIARNFNIQYTKVDTEAALTASLPDFFKYEDNGRPAILEVVTPNIESANAMKEYFMYLEQHADKPRI